MSKRACSILAILGWLAAVAAAMSVDRRVAEWVQARAADTVHSPWRVLFDKRGFLLKVIQAPGYFPFTIAVAVAAVIWSGQGRRILASALVLLSGGLGALLYSIAKWLVGRHRPINGIYPFHLTPLIGGWRGLFNSPPNLSFPSGHATLAFATAAAMTILFPRWRLAFFLAALLVAVERVLENAHYVSDVVAGAGLGVLAALLVQSCLKPSKISPPCAGPNHRGAAS